MSKQMPELASLKKVIETFVDLPISPDPLQKVMDSFPLCQVFKKLIQ